MAGLPLFKLGVLLVRTVAKPVAKTLKDQAADHPTLRRGVIALGNLLNNVQTQIEVRVMGHVPKNIKPLREEAAVSRGAEFVGEGFIFFVAAFFVVLEYVRQQSSKSKESDDKARHRAEKAAAQQARDEILERAILRMDARLARLERALWIGTDHERPEEELMRRDKLAAEHTAELRQKLAMTRVPTVAELAEAERQMLAEAEAEAAHSRLVGAGLTKEELLSGPTQRQRALASALAAIDSLGETFRQVGPIWTNGFRAGQDGKGDDHTKGQGECSKCDAAAAAAAASAGASAAAATAAGRSMLKCDKSERV